MPEDAAEDLVGKFFSMSEDSFMRFLKECSSPSQMAQPFVTSPESIADAVFDKGSVDDILTNGKNLELDNEVFKKFKDKLAENDVKLYAVRDVSDNTVTIAFLAESEDRIQEALEEVLRDTDLIKNGRDGTDKNGRDDDGRKGFGMKPPNHGKKPPSRDFVDSSFTKGQEHDIAALSHSDGIDSKLDEQASGNDEIDEGEELVEDSESVSYDAPELNIEDDGYFDDDERVPTSATSTSKSVSKGAHGQTHTRNVGQRHDAQKQKHNFHESFESRKEKAQAAKAAHEKNRAPALDRNRSQELERF
ncbi:MAG: DUF3801 domain-containing protein [Raoultibacter sp.]